MASLDSTLTIKVDATELEQAIAKIRAEVDPRTKCAIEDCTKEGLLANQVRLPLDTPNSSRVKLYLCDEHYQMHKG